MRLCFTLQMIYFFFFRASKTYDTVNNQSPPFRTPFSTPNCIFILENKLFLQDHHASFVSIPLHVLFKSLCIILQQKSQSVNIYRLKWWHYCKLAVIWNVPLCPNTEHAFVNFATAMIYCVFVCFFWSTFFKTSFYL